VISKFISLQLSASHRAWIIRAHGNFTHFLFRHGLAARLQNHCQCNT
jgi:hypothetical protein